MEETELNQEIKDTIKTIQVLKESGDYGAVTLAENDLVYLLSQK